MRPALPLIPWLVLLASCSSQPRPPTVDEANKRPANTAMAVELQVCKSDLHNTRILANESGRLAASTAATLERLAAHQQALMAIPAPPVSEPPVSALPVLAQTNRVFTVRFDFGSTRVVMPAGAASALIDDARSAPWVVLRGRTDGTSDTPAESRIARERANAVRDYLVSAGVDAARIRATYQPAGDHTADNSSPAGKGLNRRVEIEVYRALPVAANSPQSAQP
jgi:outer membrane protein OmpA-like peptidoglycan-associated protein